MMPSPKMVYLPHLSRARIVKAYRFESPRLGSHCAVLLTDCTSPSPVRYAHVMVVNRGIFVFGQQCFAVASEINKNASPDGERSHFLGVFPGLLDGAMHENLGASNEWSDLDKFEQRALALIAERFELTKPPEEFAINPEGMARNYPLPKPYPVAIPPAPPSKKTSDTLPSKKRWEFWKK
jgi:hypothetical protein